MCGIVGYIGSKQASPVLIEGLERLSYRESWNPSQAPYPAKSQVPELKLSSPAG